MFNTDPMRRRLALGAGIASLVLAASACASGSSAEPTVATPTHGRQHGRQRERG